jgi:hypothetical protein
MRRLRLAALLGVLAAAGGCVVHEREYVRPAPPCRGAMWVEGFYGPYGHWHPGYWRCPAVVVPY